MAAHSSALAWRIPWTEEPGGLSSMGHREWARAERLNMPAGGRACVKAAPTTR